MSWSSGCAPTLESGHRAVYLNSVASNRPVADFDPGSVWETRDMSLQQSIEHKLTASLQPTHLEVINESHRHSVPPGSETHFKVVVVSPAFSGQRLVQRHQSINALLASELAGELHALSMETLTPDEWTARAGTTLQSPPCLGGGKAD
jgi:BolA protein